MAIDYTGGASNLAPKHTNADVRGWGLAKAVDCYNGISYAGTTTFANNGFAMTGYDTNALQWVFWYSVGTPNLVPTLTSPPKTGTLQYISCIGFLSE